MSTTKWPIWGNLLVLFVGICALVFFRQGITQATSAQIPAQSNILSLADTWVIKSSGMPPNADIHGLAISPAFGADGTLFAGDGFGSGVFRSTDRGEHWQAINQGIPLIDPGDGSAPRRIVRCLAISPNYAQDRTLFVSIAGGGLYRSTNGGDSWERVGLEISSTSIWHIAIAPTFAQERLVMVATYGHGVYRSTDGGDSWTPSNIGIIELHPASSHIEFAPNFAITRRVFLTSFDGSIYRSDDGGLHWSLLLDNAAPGGCEIICCSPSFSLDHTLFVGTREGGLLRSLDEGNTWGHVPGIPITASVHSILFSPSYPHDHTIYVGCQTGMSVFRSTDSGETWSPYNNGFTDWLKIPQLAADPTGSGVLFAGTHGASVWRLDPEHLQPTFTSTPTQTPTPSITATPSHTATATATRTATATPSPPGPTPTRLNITDTPTPTRTYTPIPPTRVTMTLTPTSTPTPSRTATPTRTPTATATSTATATPGPTATPTPTRPIECVEAFSPESFEKPLPAQWCLEGATRSSLVAHSGQYSLRFGGSNLSTSSASFSFTLPDQLTTLGISFFWWRDSSEQRRGRDTLRVSLQDADGQELVQITLLDASTELPDWRLFARDLTPWASAARKIVFVCTTDESAPSTFYLDDLALTICSRSLPQGCEKLGYRFAEEFLEGNLSQWQQSLGYGSYTTADSVIELKAKEGFSDRFPILWTNDAFPFGQDFIFETRFRYSHFSAYGTTIGIGSAFYDGSRYLQGSEPPPGIEDILSIHQLDAWFRIALLNQVVWWGAPQDDTWHTVQVIRQGLTWVLRVDGREIGRTTLAVEPHSLYIGNPAIEIWWGTWTHLHVDYLRIVHCTSQGPVTIWMPLIWKQS
ncbi:MAG: hypothetical protein J7M05_14050 [Anaerolineae bacterium]|nr:hypothetical protein [Anaerolineae bacterium]